MSHNMYASIAAQGVMDDASPHKVIKMLMEGFIKNVSIAKGAMSRGDIQEKSIQISKAMGIIGGLKSSLNMEKGGAVALSLSNVYDRLNLLLLKASSENDQSLLDEINNSMREIKSSWDAIPESLHRVSAESSCS